MGTCIDFPKLLRLRSAIAVLGEVFCNAFVMNTKTIEGDVVKVVQHASVDTDKQLAGIKIKKDNGDVMELELPSKMANVVVTKHSYQRPNTKIWNRK